MHLTRDDGLFISDDPALVDAGRFATWIAEESWWGAGRPREIILRSLEESHVYGVYADDETQVAVARVVTDHATFAYLCDVFVDTGYRGKGIGTWLTRCIVDDMRTRGINRFLLATTDAHEVYRRAGFTPVARPSAWMEIDDRPTKPGPGPADPGGPVA